MWIYIIPFHPISQNPFGRKETFSLVDSLRGEIFIGLKEKDPESTNRPIPWDQRGRHLPDPYIVVAVPVVVDPMGKVGETAPADVFFVGNVHHPIFLWGLFLIQFDLRICFFSKWDWWKTTANWWFLLVIY